MNLVLTKKLHPCSAHKKSFLYNPFSPFYWYKILWYEWTLRSYLKGFNRYFQGLTVRHVKSHYSQNYVFVKRLSSFSLEFHWWNSWSVLSNAVKCDGRGTLIPLQQLSIATTKRMLGSAVAGVVEGSIDEKQIPFFRLTGGCHFRWQCPPLGYHIFLALICVVTCNDSSFEASLALLMKWIPDYLTF